MTNFKTTLLATVVWLCIMQSATAEDISPPTLRSDSRQFVVLKPANFAPEIGFQSLSGDSVHLSQFRGKVVVLNFWATWCLPCVREMPSLDRLVEANDVGPLAVVAVSIDRAGAAAVKPFMSARELKHLSVFLDPAQRLGALSIDGTQRETLPLWGLPISYVIDKRGLVVGYLTGAVDWDSSEAKSFLRYFTGEAS